MKKYNLEYKKLKYGVTVLRRDVIVYKKLRNAIGQFLLPKGTKVMKAYTRPECQKLRADQAVCLMIVPYWNADIYYRCKYQFLDSKRGMSEIHYASTKSTYFIGKKYKPNGFNTNIYEDCGKGFHFFCTLEEAEKY